MYVFISILILFCSALLVLIVLIQNSKGGGLASGFSSSNQVLGVRKTTDFLEKTTWTLAGVLVVLCIAITTFIPERGVTNTSSDVLENVSMPITTGAPAGFENVQPSMSQSEAPVTEAPAQQPIQEVPAK
jgi:preprotein translocase subunit SecG